MIDSRAYQPLDMKKTAVDMYMNLQRHEEELQILKKDMLNFLVFYQKKIGTLTDEIKDLDSKCERNGASSNQVSIKYSFQVIVLISSKHVLIKELQGQPETQSFPGPDRNQSGIGTHF